MKMMRLLALIFILLTVPFSVQAATLKLELAHERVDITTGFDGTSLAIFGVTDAPRADIIVTLSGPQRTVIVRKKGRVGGAWMNTDSIEFRRVPSYYDYAMTRPDAQIAPEDVLESHSVGINHLGLYSETSFEDTQKNSQFKDSLLSNMQQRGFYPLRYKSVTMIEPTFFRASFALPPGVPTGIYTVKGLLIQDGKVAAQESKSVQVGQVGFNARVYLFATQNSFFYGIVTILIALISGWAAFTFLRRD
jgi:uncharacterized protein (TIGR02186 family)